jgi:hypothetical protein
LKSGKIAEVVNWCPETVGWPCGWFSINCKLIGGGFITFFVKTLFHLVCHDNEMFPGESKRGGQPPALYQPCFFPFYKVWITLTGRRFQNVADIKNNGCQIKT